MAGHSIYINCAPNMPDLLATYPSVLNDGVGLQMGVPTLIASYVGPQDGEDGYRRAVYCQLWRQALRNMPSRS